MIYSPQSGNISKKATEALKAVGLGDRIHYKPSELSGGQQQRVAIARALINNPSIILADEPTGNLDSTSSEEIMAIFKSLHQEDRTLILVTHEADVAQRAKRLIQMKDGRVVQDKKIG
jgi:putative ABC transport system ATP-binding protein